MTTEWKPDICIYHANCADGFGAAFAVWKRWGDAIEYVPAAYGDAPPDVTSKNVLIVDFSYKRQVLEKMSGKASSVIVLDHHKSAEADLAGFNHVVGGSYLNVGRILARVSGPLQNVLTDFDMDSSGATMAWRFCHPGIAVPGMLLYVEDRDLWRFSLPESKAANAFIGTLDHFFETWRTWSEDVMGPFDEDGISREVKTAGEAILRKEERDLDRLLTATTRTMTIGGYRVPVANVPFYMASEAGNRLAEGHAFAATYLDLADGKRQFSLRSREDGVSVSEIAQRYGGGGHVHAAGFTMPSGWEGEV